MLIHANINNLTDLWKTASLPFSAYIDQEDFSYTWIAGADWPNRLWFHKNVQEDKLLLAKEELAKISVDMTIPYWNIYDHSAHELFLKHGFQVTFEQTAMIVQASNTYPIPSNFQLKLVTTKAEASCWSQLFLEAFGYLISPEVVYQNCTTMDYYLAYDQQEAVGTAMTHTAASIFGIHSVGVPPAFRRRGFAALIMKTLLNQAAQEAPLWVGLQASSMGKGLYLKLGFEEQFTIRNYRLASSSS